MKILVVFYSRSGNTKKLAEFLAKRLNADIDEISSPENYSGILGYIIAGRQALFKKQISIKYAKAPENYSLIVIGTPLWAGKMTPAVRTYLNENKSKMKNVAFFVTSGGGNSGEAIKEMESISKKTIARLELKTSEVQLNEFEKTSDFLRIIKNAR